MAEVALAWIMARRGVASTLVGARTVEQLSGNLTAATLPLSREHMARLDEASAPVTGFSASLTSPMIRRMVYGGHDVRGWAD